MFFPPLPAAVQWNLSPLCHQIKKQNFIVMEASPCLYSAYLRKRKHFCSYLLTVTRLMFVYFLSIAANGMNVCYFMHVLTFTFYSTPPFCLVTYIDEDENEILELSSNETFSVMLKIPEECVSEEKLPDMLQKRVSYLIYYY